RVHPLSSLGVTLNLEILAQLFITDGPALVQKRLDFLEDERVPLDGGRVVRLLVPDPFPDLRGLFGTGQATHLRKIFDGPVEPVEDRQPARPAPSSRLVRSLFLAWHVPNLSIVRYAVPSKKQTYLTQPKGPYSRLCSACNPPRSEASS